VPPLGSTCLAYTLDATALLQPLVMKPTEASYSMGESRTNLVDSECNRALVIDDRSYSSPIASGA